MNLIYKQKTIIINILIWSLLIAFSLMWNISGTQITWKLFLSHLLLWLVCIVFQGFAGIRIFHLQSELLKSQKEWEQTFNSIPDYIAILDNNRNIVKCNTSMARGLGLSVKTIQGMKCYLCFHKSDEIPDYCPFLPVMEDGQTHVQEIHINHLEKDFLVTVSPIYDDNGQIKGCVHTAHDITRLKKAENMICREKEMLQKYIDLAGLMVVIINQDQAVTHVNQKVCEILGYDKADIIGKNWFDNFIPEKNREKVRQVFTGSAPKNIQPVKRYENPVLTKNNQERIISWNNTLLKDSNGNITGSLSSGEDITERWKIMNNLQEKEERIRLLLDSTAEAIYGIDLNGICTFCNRSCLKMTGYDKESDLLNKNIHNLIHHSKHDGKPCTQENCLLFLTSRKGISVHSDTEVFWRKDKTCFPAEYWSYPIWKDKKIIGSVVTFIDITARKNIEAMLMDAKESAEAANRAKTAFLAGMSHELRTPLNGILGYTQILKGDNDLTDKQREGIDIIEKSGTHLLSLLNEILDLAKIESGKIELYQTEFHFISMIKGVNDMIKNRAEKKGIGFKYECNSETDMSSVYVYADEKRLAQVLINLLGNAVKFTDKGYVMLRVTYKPYEPLNDKLSKSKFLFEIEDTGIGISNQDLEKIFDPFFQAGEQQYKAKGTGLGLSITRNIIELMNSSLKVNSSQGQGSVFSFELVLPASMRHTDNVCEQEKKIIGIKNKKPKILIIDDEKNNCSFFYDLLTPLGFELKQAENGEQGLKKTEEFMPDLIISDLVMPVMDGFEFISSIRSSAALKNNIIIASSASVFKEHQQKSYEAGADDFLGKPIDTRHLFKQLQTHLCLEWEYENTVSLENKKDKPEDMILPCKEILEKIYKMTELGDIIKIRKQLEDLESKGSDFKVFTKKLRPLVEEFRIEDIGIMMKKCLKSQPGG
ncbi:Two component system histidine kinase, PAS domain-containing [Desulfonema limicola]|uniref:histidine kinase n=1 Tax=Desulfonema limicola TaxID=45656 RepID=A0A975BCH3_9BACT|nr:PAS domain-containing hybrid sensor histidine kinase/response regulator [Desulfonema limicola]QTA82832.1 Two component system histidine kinase, PAS domain-containing [Desulfonema limicola]